MRYQRNLQVALQERYRRLYKSAYSVLPQELAYFRAFLDGAPALRSITSRVATSEPDLDPAQWVEEHFEHGCYSWPPTEQGRAKVAWHFMGRLTDADQVVNLSGIFSHERNLDASAREMIEAVVEPFVEYLQAQLGAANDILYLLQRYVCQVEWFDRLPLYDAYQRDTTRGESGYEIHLRRFLFGEGIDYPFSQPASASGAADVVADLDSDSPLVCEVKLFDGRRYTKRHVAAGLRQALEYARDYRKTEAFLVVFNLSDRPLALPSERPAGDWPPRLHLGDVTVYMVAVRAKPQLPASKLGKYDPIVLSREDLTMASPAGEDEERGGDMSNGVGV